MSESCIIRVKFLSWSAFCKLLYAAGVASAVGDAVGSTLGDGLGSMLGEGDGVAVALVLAMWSDPPSHVLGMLFCEYQPFAMCTQFGPGRRPLSRQ